MRRTIADCRVLLVEDEAMVALLLEDMLADMGCTVAGVASRLDGALAAARTLDYDVAILDVNLDGSDTYPVADAVAGRALPSVFVTGYGPADLREGYRHVPVLAKPFREADLRAVLETTLAAAVPRE